jgi:hypothetical protein
MGIHSLPARRWGRIGLVALLGLTLALVAVTASNARAGAPGHAVEAKKKCKKKHRRSAGVAKKKCKKHPRVQQVTLPAPGPLVRGTLAWSANDEVDLHAFDASGNHAGWDFGINGVVNHIPNAHHNGDVGPGGPQESFTDDIFVVGGPSNREFSYIACLYDSPSPSAYTATFTGVTKSGQSSSLTLNGPAFYTLTTAGGPPLPDPTTVC